MAMPDVVVEPIWAPGRLFLTATRRHVAFAVIVALSALWAARPLFTVIVRSLNRAEYEHYSHIVLLPCIVAYLLWLNRHSIVQRAQPGLAVGAILVAMAGAVVWLADTAVVGDEPETRLAIAMGGVILMWLGGFIACYGMAALRTVIFPFAFLLFMIPLPPKALHAVIVFLQRGSAEASAVIFGLIGMPVFRQDLMFALPGLTIHVAEECSGIRSSLALLVSGLVMTYLFLRTTAARTILGLLIIPLAIVKNGLRIVVLSWLAVHVDPSFITESVVHRTGGIPTFLLSLAVLGMFIWVLRKSEQAITARRQLSTL